MRNIILESMGKEFLVDLNGIDDVKNWNVIEDESYVLPKSEFIVSKCREVFPHLDLDYTQIISLSSRNKTIRDFLSNANLEFISAVKVPKSLSDIISPSEFSSIEYGTRRYNEVLVNESKELFKLSEDYKAKNREIRNRYQKLRDKETANPIVKVLTLTLDDLPVSLSLLIDNYSPSDETAPNARRYGRELLLRYQKSLIKTIKEEKIENVDNLLSELSAK